MNVMAEGGHRWQLPEDKQDLARQRAGDWVWFGIRPEHIQLANDDTPSSEVNSQHHKIDVVESMGNELYLYFQLGGDKMVSRIPFDADRVVASGDSALLKFKVSHCHLFDLDTEEALG